MLDVLKSFFGFDGVSKTALKIVDKIAGTDWTPKEKAEYTLKYMEATKHQSPARRFIATLYIVIWAVLVGSWLFFSVIGTLFEAPSVLLLAENISGFMEKNINLSLSIIIGFYFVISMKR